MRLLQINSDGRVGLAGRLKERNEPYAILSHTWADDQEEEVTFADLRQSQGQAEIKAGYQKLLFCGERARKDGIKYFWVDTCCINKADSTELSEAITSMYRWYRDAAKCYVYLSDVSVHSSGENNDTQPGWIPKFQASRWFTRGWTLQELLAPKTVEFFSRDDVLLGTKAELKYEIQAITRIPVKALCNESMDLFTVEERFRWVEDRKTTKPEDKAYCLFGIFNEYPYIQYGEGEESAFRRLKRAIGVTFTDLDREIRASYENGRLRVERLSGQSLPLEHCFINLGITHHTRSQNTSRRNDGLDLEAHAASERVSNFSLAARLRVETPVKSHQVSLSTLFEPRKQEGGTVSRPNRILIWGRAGMGKTTLCKKIVHDVYNRGLWSDIYDRVVWLPLRRLKRIYVHDVIDLLQKEFSLAGLGERLPEALRRLVHDERTLFLLDGLDEVSFRLDEDDPMGRLLRELMSRSHVIVTSRPHHVSHVFGHRPPDLEVETVGFYPQQVEEYLMQVASEAKMSEEKINQIRSFVESRPLVQSLARIPIQMDAICHTWDVNGFRQNDMSMTALYRMITQSLWKDNVHRLDKEDRGRPITRQQLAHLSLSRMEPLIQEEECFLQELGFRGLCEEVIEFDSAYIDSFKTKPLFDDVPVHLSFLRTSDSTGLDIKPTTHFIHLTFQEFFAAQYFVRYWTSCTEMPLYRGTSHTRASASSNRCVPPEEFVKWNKYIDRYDIFWRFVVGLLHSEHEYEHLDRFLHTLDDEPRDLIGLTHQRLVIHCLGELTSPDDKLRVQLRSLEDCYLQWILCQERAERTQNYHVARGTLLMWETECSDDILERLLNNNETEKNALQVVYWRSSISSRIFDIAWRKIDSSTDEDVRASALQIVGRHCGCSEKAKIDNLFSTKKCSGNFVKEVIKAWNECAWTLSEPATNILAELLRDPDSDVRSRAAEALRRQTSLSSDTTNVLGGWTSLSSDTTNVLVQLLRDPDRNVRSRAVQALRGRTSLSSDTTNVLVQLLRDPRSDVRSRAVQALGGQTSLSSDTTNVLVQLLRDPDSGVRYHAADALRVWTSLSSDTTNVLVQLLRDPDSDIRSRAVHALGGRTSLSSDTTNVLVQLLRDPDRNVRSRAAEALRGRTSLSSDTTNVLVQLLRDPDRNVRSRAAEALRRQTSLSSDTKNVLVQLLRDPDSGVRSGAAEALGKQATLSSDTTNVLVQLLRDPDSGVRYHAAETLRGQTSLSSDTTNVLVQLLRDPAGYVRSRAGAVLRGRTSLSSDTKNVLVQLLRDPRSDVRSRAVQALGEQTSLSSDTTNVLVQLLRDPRSDVRSRAAEALGGQTSLSSDTTNVLVQLLRDPRSGVRSRAAGALRRQTSLSSDTTNVLVQLLRDPDSDIRSRAAEALGGRTSLSSDTTNVLVQLLRDPDRNVRSRAVQALGGRTSLSSDTINVLVQLLRDPDSYVRSGAAEALGRQTSLSSDTTNVLFQLLRDPDSDVRSGAAEALGKQATLSSDTINVLVQLLRDPRSDVRSGAVQALGGRTSLSSDTTNVLVQLLRDPDSDVRSRAAEALRGQTSLSSDVLNALVQQLPNLNEALSEMVGVAIRCHEFRALLPTLKAPVLRHILPELLTRDFALFFGPDRSLAIGPSSNLQIVLLDRQLSVSFVREWQKACDSSGSPASGSGIPEENLP